MSCLLQAKLSACRRECLYPLSSRSSFPRPLYVARELLREEHCSTIWFAGGDLAGLFCFVQRWGRKRETVSLFLMLQEGEQDHGCSWHEFLGPGVVRRERRGGKGRKGGREKPSARHLRYKIPETADFKTSELNPLPDSPLNGTLKSGLANVFYKYTEALQKEVETIQSCTWWGKNPN